MKRYRLLNPDGVSVDGTRPGTLGGNAKLRIYGRLDCPSANAALPKGYARHRVFFADEASALAAGYRPCGRCLPSRYAQWKRGRTVHAIATVLCAALLLSCSPAEDRQPASQPAIRQPQANVVDAGGIGRVRVGTTLTQLSALLGEEVRASYEDFEACDHVRPHALAEGVLLMVLSDTVARVEVTTTGVMTREGAGVGDTEERVLALYKGMIRVLPHKYTGPEGHYLVVTPPGDTLHQIIFETDGKVVTLYRAGRRPAVEYIEGCA